jgi:hypothetical protein
MISLASSYLEMFQLNFGFFFPEETWILEEEKEWHTHQESTLAMYCDVR